jgi:hypothetical protein
LFDFKGLRADGALFRGVGADGARKAGGGARDPARREDGRGEAASTRNRPRAGSWVDGGAGLAAGGA